jgi:response regulator RpfG family c-di-GMP phosphodiesterase
MVSEDKVSKKYTVLVVDDEPENVKFLQRTLRKNYNVVGKYSPFEALEYLKETYDDVALIISDQRMPDMTGTEFMAKSIESHPYTVKVLLTGYTDIEAMIDAINRCELFYYVNKPWDPSQVHEVAEKAIERYELNLLKNYYYFTHHKQKNKE